MSQENGKVTIDVERPTGPRITHSHHYGWLEPYQYRAAKVSKKAVATAVAIAQHKAAVTVAVTVAATILTHTIFSILLLMNAGYQVKTSTAYTGPGDINGTAYALWSTRCITSIYTGNVAEIFDGATGTTTQTIITCSTGGILNQTVNSLAVTCAVSCRVRTLYDQSGSNSCTGSVACDMIQSTNANRPVLNTSLLNGKIGLVFNGSTNCLQATGWAVGQAQPFSLSGVLNATSSATGDWYSDSTASWEFYSHEGGNPNRVDLYLGGAGVATQTAADNSTHAVQGLASGAASFLYVDGSAGASANPGTNGIGTAIPMLGARNNVVCQSGSNFIAGNLFEFGLWASDKSANNSTMNSNQHSYWSF